MSTLDCYGTHGLVARTLALADIESVPKDAPSPMSVHEDETYCDKVFDPPSQSRLVEEDVFQLDVDANQSCPFTKEKVKEWTESQQAFCEDDMKTRSASSVDELRELVGFLM